jgi:hypothetical protein
VQGESPFFSSSISPSSNRSLSSSAESRCLKQWRKKASHRSITMECDSMLHRSVWGLATPIPPTSSPPQRVSIGSWNDVKMPVLAPSTFVEHAIIASEWTRVQPRRRRSTSTLPSPTTAGRGRNFKSLASLMWIKKNPTRPIPGPLGSEQPSVFGKIDALPRRSGLHHILGFHWRSQRGIAPVSRGIFVTMAGRPDPAGKSGLFSAIRQGGGGNPSAGPSFGGGGNGAAFPQRGSHDNSAQGGFASNAGFGFNAGPQGNQPQQFQGGNDNNAFPQPS